MSAFRTIEISDARVEGLRFVTVKSRALAGRADLTVFMPREAENKSGVPLVILLHGVYGSHWGWALSGNAHRTVQRLIASGQIPPLALAMPSDGLWGDGSGYVPHASQNFEKWIVEEVPLAAVEAMPAVSESSPLFICGLSMGGFGALRLAAKHPGRFRAVSGHSSITHFEQLKQFVEEPLYLYPVEAGDVSVLETMVRNRASLPPIRFDCGTEDPLLKDNRELHLELERQGIAHRYEEFPGGHEWKYWERHLEDSLRFFAEVGLGALRRPRRV